MLNKKKLFVRMAAVVVGIFCLFVLVIVVLLSRSAHQFNEFKREHADAPRIVAEAIGPLVADYNTTSSVPAQPANTEPPITDPELEISSIDHDYRLADRFLHGVRPYPVNRSFDFVAAADYPEEITSGTIPCGPRLRRHIAERVGMMESHWLRELADQGPDAPYAKGRITSNTLQLLPHLNRARQLMSYQNWQAMDPIRNQINFSVAVYSDYMGELAFMRATLRGEDAVASMILVNMVRLKLLCVLSGVAHPRNRAGFLGGLDEVLFGVALTDDFRGRAGLEQVAALLGRDRALPSGRAALA